MEEAAPEAPDSALRTGAEDPHPAPSDCLGAVLLASLLQAFNSTASREAMHAIGPRLPWLSGAAPYA